MRSNYDILGVTEGSSEKEIRDAFRRMALEFHSDRGGQGDKFIEIKQAYEDLKVGKKYPDTDDERLRNTRVYEGDEDAQRRNQILGQEIFKEMKAAEEWAGALNRAGATATRLFGSKTMGEIELERKANGALSIKGNFVAGTLSYDGPIIMQGSITSPSWEDRYRTVIRLTRGDFKLVDPLENKYKIENGARISAENGDVIVGNVFGRKQRVNDPEGRVGLFHTRKHLTHISAPNGRIVAQNVVNTVLLEADIVIVLNMEDDVKISAREILVYGGKITHDCVLELRQGGTIRFFETFSIQGLSEDAAIVLENGKKIRLSSIKTKKIRSLAGSVKDAERYGKDQTMVGNGFVITYEMLDNLSKKPAGRGWKGRFGI